jgi:hypothetical protein
VYIMNSDHVHPPLTSFFHFLFSIYSFYRGDSVCQVPKALHCTLLTLPPLPPPSIHSWAHMKQLQEVSLFYFTHVYEASEPYSPPSSHPFTLPPPQVLPPTLYLFCSPVFHFIFNSKVHVQRGFSMYPSCEYTFLWSVQPFFTLPYPFPPTLHYSTFIIHCYARYLNKYNPFLYRCLSFSFPFPCPSTCSSSTITNMFYI